MNTQLADQGAWAKVTLYFTRSETLESRLIRLLTRSQWSHVAISYGSQYVVDSMRGFGVRRRSLAGFLQAFPDHEKVEIMVPASLGPFMRDWLDEQLGKPYDDGALWGFLIPGRDWSDPDAWFCFELAAMYLSMLGFHMPHMASRVTGRLLYDLAREAAS